MRKKSNEQKNIVFSAMPDECGIVKAVNGIRRAPLLFAVRICSSALMIAGLLMMLLSVFPSVKINFLLSCGLMISISIVLNFFFYGGYRSETVLVVFAAALILLIAGLFIVPADMGALKNDFADCIMRLTGRIMLHYGESAEFRSVPMLICFMMVASVLICFIVNAKRGFLPIFMLLMGAVGTGVGVFLSDIGLLLWSFGLLLSLSLRHTERDSQRGQTEGKYSFIAVSQCVIIIAMALLGSIVFAGSDTSAAGEDLTALIHEVRYDSSTVSMPNGRLKKLHALKRSNAKALSIRSETKLPEERIYFRGMIGEAYDGSSWAGLDKKELASDYALFYWLHEEGFYAQTSVSNALNALADEEKAEIDHRQLSLSNISACKQYFYLPYQAENGAYLDPALIGDANVFSKNHIPKWAEGGEANISYSASELGGIALRNEIVKNQETEAVSRFLSCEQSYSAFVRDNYLDLTPEVRTSLAELFGEFPDAMTLPQITERIINALDENLTYNEAINTDCGESDFIAYVLDLGKSGYSVHYACCAAMMLRYFGVPARYVEGYMLNSDEAAMYGAGETLFITENNAHAWAEYYLDGVGWLPFDVTPGYIDESILPGADNKGGSDKTENETSYQNQNLNSVPLVRPNKQNRDEISAKNIIALIIGLCVLCLAAFIVRTIILRLRLRRKLREAENAQNNEYIAIQYGYCVMLVDRLKGEAFEFPEDIRKMNMEALFSDHIICDARRAEMAEFSSKLLKDCKRERGLLKRFYDRFIACIYV